MLLQIQSPDWVRFNLTYHFPLAKRSAAMKSFPFFWMFTLFAGCFAIFWQANNFTAIYLAIACLVCVALCAISLIYHLSWKNHFYYAIVGNRLIIRKGVLRTKRIQISLSKITSINCGQSGLEVFFELYHISINKYGGQPLVLRGFSREIAEDLLDYLEAVLESSLGAKMAGSKLDRYDTDVSPLTEKVVSILQNRKQIDIKNSDDFKKIVGQ